MGCGQSRFGGRHCAIRPFGTKHHLSGKNDVSRILRFKSACMIRPIFRAAKCVSNKAWMQKWAASVGEEHQDTGNAPQHMAKRQAAEIY
jgi:hypothetical protein